MPDSGDLVMRAFGTGEISAELTTGNDTSEDVDREGQTKAFVRARFRRSTERQ